MPINHVDEIAYEPAAPPGDTVAGQSAGLQPLLVRDSPTEFGAGLRRGVCALLKPLCIHRVYRVYHGARP